MFKTPLYTTKGKFENYGIDEYGNIYSNKLNRNKWKQLCWKINENGYANISLRRDNKTYYFKIHKLVMLNFSDEIVINKPDINHKDGNKLNNHISNLEYVTRSENLKHAWNTGLRHPTPSYAENNGNNKFSSIQIKQMLYRYFIDKINKRSICEEFGISISALKNIIHRHFRIREYDEFIKEHEDLILKEIGSTTKFSRFK